MRNVEWIEQQLIGTKKWGRPTPAVAERAGYRCEYCNLDFLASLENYKQWHIDHIVPQSSGGGQAEENLALSCRHCKFVLKGRWNPNPSGEEMSREELIRLVREHLEQAISSMQVDLERVRTIVGYSGGRLFTNHPGIPNN